VVGDSSLDEWRIGRNTLGEVAGRRESFSVNVFPLGSPARPKKLPTPSLPDESRNLVEERDPKIVEINRVGV